MLPPVPILAIHTTRHRSRDAISMQSQYLHAGCALPSVSSIHMAMRLIRNAAPQSQLPLPSAIHDLAWLKERHDWPGLQGVVMVESTREIADKIERETRFYITSLAWLACQLGPVIRSHWAIENKSALGDGHGLPRRRVPHPHRSRSRQLHHLKHMAHNLIRNAPGKDSLRLKRKTAAWDDDFLASLLAA